VSSDGDFATIVVVVDVAGAAVSEAEANCAGAAVVVVATHFFLAVGNIFYWFNEYFGYL